MLFETFIFCLFFSLLGNVGNVFLTHTGMHAHTHPKPHLHKPESNFYKAFNAYNKTEMS